MVRERLVGFLAVQTGPVDLIRANLGQFVGWVEVRSPTVFGPDLLGSGMKAIRRFYASKLPRDCMLLSA